MRETVKAVSTVLAEPLRQAVEMALPDGLVVADNGEVSPGLESWMFSLMRTE